MAFPIYRVCLWALCLLSMLHLLASTAAGYQRNTSSPLFRQCRQSTDYPRASSQAKLFAKDVADKSVAFDIRLLNELQRPASADLREEYVTIYNTFQRRTNCVPWDWEREHLSDEVKKTTYECMCSSIRNSIVEAVRSVYRCDVAAAAHGQLSAVYLALGRRVNVFKRAAVSLYGDLTQLESYDSLVDQCFIQFFENINSSTQRSGDTATKPSITSEPTPSATPPVTATSKPPASSFPWFLVILLVITAAAFMHFFRLHQEWRPLRVEAPSPLVGVVAAVETTIADTDGVAQPD